MLVLVLVRVLVLALVLEIDMKLVDFDTKQMASGGPDCKHFGLNTRSNSGDIFSWTSPSGAGGYTGSAL